VGARTLYCKVCRETVPASPKNKAQQQAESKACEFLATADQYHALNLLAVLASTSWHLTKPLRGRWTFSIHKRKKNEETSCSGKGEVGF